MLAAVDVKLPFPTPGPVRFRRFYTATPVSNPPRSSSLVAELSVDPTLSPPLHYTTDVKQAICM